MWVCIHTHLSVFPSAVCDRISIARMCVRVCACVGLREREKGRQRVGGGGGGSRALERDTSLNVLFPLHVAS